MNTTLTTFGALLALGLTLSAPTPAQVRMTQLRAKARIVDGVATTTLEQTLRNDGPRQAEAVWVLPLPPGAVADGFEMTVNGVRTSGEVLDAGGARGVYESIVRRRRDPGLLEFFGRGCLRANIFPIPPRGESEVVVSFRQVLPEVGGLRSWSFALNAAGLDGRPPEQVVLDLSIESRRSISNVFSPVPGVHVVQKSKYEARASFEGGIGSLPRRELAVFYGLTEEEFGLDLLTHRKEEEREGTFMMLISPKRDWEDEEVLPKSITVALDVSGSMAGRKLEQAKGALRFLLETLRPGDRFNVVPFSTQAEPFFREPVEAHPEKLAEARLRIERLDAMGGTNIDDALRVALGEGDAGGQGEHVPLVLLLTDGKATAGVTDTKQILKRAQVQNVAAARCFVFGVGDGVNTRLLDKLAAENGGARNYVREGEDIEVKASDLLTKLSHPVLTDLRVEVDGIEITKRVPASLPPLFKGGRLVVFGRYRGEGPRIIRLSGRAGETLREYVYEGTFGTDPVPANDFVPALWAERRVAVLLDAIRLNGADPELTAEVKRLGREHRIVTPYTSHLIVEDGLRVSGGGGGYRGPGDAVPAGGGGGGAGGGPASPGPVRPGASGPATPGPATPGAPRAPRARQAPDLDAIAKQLRDAGVLPKDAPREELRRLAGEVARELRAADDALRNLGREESGATAVDDSAYLWSLIAGGDRLLTGSDDFFLGRGEVAQRRPSVIDLFTRWIGDKVFVLREGVWTDREYDPKARKPRTVIEAYSAEYFALLRERPKLGPYLSFSTRLVVVYEGRVYEITEPTE